MTNDIQRVKQDLAIMEQAVAGKAAYGPQHVGLYMGFGIAGVTTLLLALFTTLLNTLPTRFLMIPLFLGLPFITAWMLSPKPFRIASLFNTGCTKAESNVVAVITGLVILAFAFLLKNLGVPYPIVPSVGMMLSAVYLFPLGWGRPQYYNHILCAAVFFVMAVAYPFIPAGYYTAMFGAGLAVLGFGSVVMIRQQLRKGAE